MKIEVDIQPPTRWREQFLVECKLPSDLAVIGITVIGMGATVGDALVDAGRQIAPSRQLDALVKGESIGE